LSAKYTLIIEASKLLFTLAFNNPPQNILRQFENWLYGSFRSLVLPPNEPRVIIFGRPMSDHMNHVSRGDLSEKGPTSISKPLITFIPIIGEKFY
jgi:hypothetical protein